MIRLFLLILLLIGSGVYYFQDILFEPKSIHFNSTIINRASPVALSNSNESFKDAPCLPRNYSIIFSCDLETGAGRAALLRLGKILPDSNKFNIVVASLSGEEETKAFFQDNDITLPFVLAKNLPDNIYKLLLKQPAILVVDVNDKICYRSVKRGHYVGPIIPLEDFLATLMP
jgi:hypothetical protein